MTDELIPAEGISRRDMLKRSAVVGGASAMVWAAPSITTFGARAFGSTSGTPRSIFSNFAALIKCTKNGTTTTYRLQYEVDEGGWVEPGTAQNVAGGCVNSLGLYDEWSAAGVVNPAAPYDLSAEGMNGSPLTLTWGVNVTLCVADDVDCTFDLNGGGVASLKQSTRCVEGEVSENGKCIVWKGPF
jgi:hypothetical protein